MTVPAHCVQFSGNLSLPPAAALNPTQMSRVQLADKALLCRNFSVVGRGSYQVQPSQGALMRVVLVPPGRWPGTPRGEENSEPLFWKFSGFDMEHNPFFTVCPHNTEANNADSRSADGSEQRRLCSWLSAVWL